MPACLLHYFLSQTSFEMAFPRQDNWLKSIHYNCKQAHLDNVIKAAFKRKEKKKTEQRLIAPHDYLQFSSIPSKLLTILS